MQPAYLHVSMHPESNSSSSELKDSASVPSEEENPINVHDGHLHRRTDENHFMNWLTALAPLTLHLGLVIFLTAFLLVYVNQRVFGTTSRRPAIAQSDGSTVFQPHSQPLQSDITTLISSLVVVSRLLAGMWCAATTWRYIFILLETRGLSISEISRILSFRVFPTIRPWSEKTQTGSLMGVYVFILLIVALPSQLSSPIVTGSITWEPSYTLLHTEAPVMITSSNASNGVAIDLGGLRPNPSTSLITEALRYALSAYTDSEETGVSKRIIEGARHLSVGSELANITLPYFAIKQIDWISNPATELNQTQYGAVRRPPNPGSNSGPNTTYREETFEVVGAFSVVPKSAQCSSVSDGERGTTWTALLAGYVTSTQEPDSGGCTNATIFGDLSRKIGYYNATSSSSLSNLGIPTDWDCYAYAWITFEAGAVECRDCRISSPTIVGSENDTALTVKSDEHTEFALDLMPQTIFRMVALNVSLPRTHNNLDGYIKELLQRAYVANWILASSVAVDPPRSTEVRIAILGTKANVARWRVWLWISLNLVLTLSGLGFVFLQRKSPEPLVSDPAVAALLLDSGAVLHRNERSLCAFSSARSGDTQLGRLRLRKDDSGHRRLDLVECQ